jgi:hypothetical protein
MRATGPLGRFGTASKGGIAPLTLYPLFPQTDQNRYNFNAEGDTSTVYEETELCPESSRIYKADTMSDFIL